MCCYVSWVGRSPCPWYVALMLKMIVIEMMMMVMSKMLMMILRTPVLFCCAEIDCSLRP
jgi:hypothetical protein